MRLLGTNAYVWDAGEQSRLLLEAVLPVATEHFDAGCLERFYFDRFDARGPHVFVVFGVPESIAGATRRQLDTAIDQWLESHPPTASLDTATVEKRHSACRGKALCNADFGDEIVALGDVVRFALSDQDYPFSIANGVPDSDGLWKLLAALPVWASRQVQARPERPAVAAALVWMATFDHHLAIRGFDVGSYFRHHASTLLMALPRRLEEEPEVDVLASVSKAVSSKNRRIFDSVWTTSVEEHRTWSGLPELADRIMACGSADVRQRVVRELVHATLKQLALPVSLHVPIVLYGWGRHAAIEVTP